MNRLDVVFLDTQHLHQAWSVRKSESRWVILSDLHFVSVTKRRDSIVVANMMADMVADMEVGMMGDIEMDKVGDMVDEIAADMELDMVTDMEVDKVADMFKTKCITWSS